MNALIQKSFFSSATSVYDEGIIFADNLSDEINEWPVFLFHQGMNSAIQCPLHVIKNLQECHVLAQSDDEFPVSARDNIATLKQVMNDQSFGLWFLYNGYPALLVYNVALNTLQPILEELLNISFDVFEPLNPYTNIISNTIVTGLLMPLNLSFTRLSIQPPFSYHERQAGNLNYYYFSFFSVFTSIRNREEPAEAGYLVLYHPRILVPCLLLSLVKNTISVASDIVIDEVTAFRSTGILLKLIQVSFKLFFIGIETALVTPFELAQSRLLIQGIKSSKATPFSTAVKPCPTRYNGVWDCIKSVFVDERCASVGEQSDASSSLNDKELAFLKRCSKNRKQTQGATYWGGLQSLYRGFWPRYVISIVEWTMNSLKMQEDW